MPRYQLPYFRPADQLPDQLPTTAEIEAASTTLPTIRNPRHGRIVAVKERFVAKYGTLVSENEGHALLFIEETQLSILAPKLYAMYREGGKLYIIMELMPGEQLSKVWDKLSEDEKFSISHQLKAVWDTIRSLPPREFYGDVTGGPLQHRFFLWVKKIPSITGPFETEEDLNRALALRSKVNWGRSLNPPWTSEYFARHLPKALKGHPSTFTHCDLQQKNILVEEIPASQRDCPETPRFRVSAVIDWETAGWYPNYWEYAACFVDMEWDEDWPRFVEEILEPWPLESAMLRMVRQDLEY